jgi:hypothetical protein
MNAIPPCSDEPSASGILPPAVIEPVRLLQFGGHKNEGKPRHPKHPHAEYTRAAIHVGTVAGRHFRISFPVLDSIARLHDTRRLHGFVRWLSLADFEATSG